MRATTVALLCLVFAGCAYENAAGDAALELNVCVEDDDCGIDGECIDGMCIAKDVQDPLAVMLTVTPQRAPDGSAARPVVLDRFVVDGPDELELNLPFPIDVLGLIRDGGVPIGAEVRFEPVLSVPGQQIDAVRMSTAERTKSEAGESDYAVRLLRGVDYEMTVTPTDPELPPFRRILTIEAGEVISVDYADLAMREQTFAFSNVPERRTLEVRAFDAVTGDAISSAAIVEDGKATVLFSPGWTPYLLEVTAKGTYDEDAANPGLDCKRATSSFPTLRIQSEELDNPQADLVELALPVPRELITFEGTIELCDDFGAVAEGVSVDALPITLRSRNVLLDPLDPEDPTMAAFTGSFTATADAREGLTRQRYTFCVEVVPGEYDVVVTPPPATQCALFAETRLIKAPGEGDAASGTLLAIPSAARLTATLQTMDLSPLAGADVSAVALGRRGSIMLEENDPSVTNYNRSGQTSTDESGTFTLPVDLGSYDVIMKPPPSSGFAWQVRHDVAIGRRGASFATVIDMASPIVLQGTLRYGEVAESSLEGAEIRAFAIVEREVGQERGIPVGKATADASGGFTLLLPPSIREGW